MTKKILSAVLAVILTISLSACGGKENAGKAKLPAAQSGGSGSDFQKNMVGSNSSEIENLCETEKGYYLQYDAFIYYVDKESKTATILCNKPECSHLDDYCNAWTNGHSLSAFKEKLYFNNSDYVEENGGYKNMGRLLKLPDVYFEF